jgi:hypothetical protein
MKGMDLVGVDMQLRRGSVRLYRGVQPSAVVEQEVARPDKDKERRQGAGGLLLLDEPERIGQEERLGAVIGPAQVGVLHGIELRGEPVGQALLAPLEAGHVGHLQHATGRQRSENRRGAVEEGGGAREAQPVTGGGHQRGGEVAAGRLARDDDAARVAAILRRLLPHPGECAGGVVEGRWELVGRRQTVVDVEDHKAHQRVAAGEGPVGLLGAEGEAAAMHIEEHGEQALAVGGAVDIEPLLSERAVGDVAGDLAAGQVAAAASEDATDAGGALDAAVNGPALEGALGPDGGGGGDGHGQARSGQGAGAAALSQSRAALQREMRCRGDGGAMAKRSKRLQFCTTLPAPLSTCTTPLLR